MECWLSKDIWNWDARYESGTELDAEAWKRAYEIWDRAKFLIDKNDNLFCLSDGITNLKRSINQRLKNIEKVYHFKNIDFENKAKGYLELLEQFDIVRPLIMKELLRIRNEIEHNDALPPNANRCQELVDIVWYFLKSTDSLVQILKKSYYFQFYDDEGSETQYGFSVSVDYNSHSNLKICGWFPASIVSLSEKEDFLEVFLKDFNGPEKFKNTNYHQDKLETDRWVNGNIRINNKTNYKNIIKKLLITY